MPKKRELHRKKPDTDSNRKKKIGNRIKGRNAKISPVNNLHPQYHEKQFYYMPYLLFFIVLLVAAWTRTHYLPSITPALSILISLVVITILIFAFNFQELTIDLNENTLVFGFGIQYTKIKIKDITACTPASIPASKFIGLGIFKGFDGSIAYATYHRGIRIVTDKHEYYLSTHNPEILCRLIEEQKC
ncbi:hypothetical protein K9M79_00470 [Candidatus Woesearchaeota archaeon]|nr:hypothetical protein [Candidatus Woesearchaeota archaeon]